MKSEVRQRIEQIRRGEVPRGYKKTKAGILPVDWNIYLIKDCLERVEHPVSVQADEMYTQIGIRSHGKGLFFKEPVSGEALGKKAVFWIEPDCFILNIVFAWEQAIGKTTQNEVGMIGSHRFPMYRSVDGKIDIDYLIEYFMTKRGKDILEAASPGGAGRNRTLGQDRFMKSKIILPSKPEQQKIAEIIKLQERVIELNSRIIRQLELMKKACLRKMFPEHGNNVPEVRFPGFTDSWEQRKVSECAEFRRGSFPQPYGNKEWYDGEGAMPFVQVADVSDDMKLVKDTKQKISKLAQPMSVYAEEKSVLVTLQGSIGRVAITQYGAFVDRTVLIFDKYNKDIDKVFWAYIIKEKFIDEAKKAPGGTIKTITKEVLSDFDLMLPSYEEQQKIGEYFEGIDDLITLHQCKLNEEKQKKKALMQLLFSGIVRVNA